MRRERLDPCIRRTSLPPFGMDGSGQGQGHWDSLLCGCPTEALLVSLQLHPGPFGFQREAETEGGGPGRKRGQKGAEGRRQEEEEGAREERDTSLEVQVVMVLQMQ